jgi:hypothetical protein
MKRLTETAEEDREAFGMADRGKYFTNDFEEYQAREFQDALIEELHGLFFHDVWGLACGYMPHDLHVHVHPHLMLDIEKAHYLLSKPVPAPSKMEQVKRTRPQRWYLSFGTVYFYPFMPSGSQPPIEETQIRLLLRPDEVHPGGRIDWCGKRGLTIVREEVDEYWTDVKVVCEDPAAQYGRWQGAIRPSMARRVDLLNRRQITVSMIEQLWME